MTWTMAITVSLLVEAAVAVVVARPVGRPRHTCVAAAAAATLLTHPLAWAAAASGVGPWAARAVAIELCVIGAEGAAWSYAARTSPRASLFAAAACNLASWGVGAWLVG